MFLNVNLFFQIYLVQKNRFMFGQVTYMKTRADSLKRFFFSSSFPTRQWPCCALKKNTNKKKEGVRIILEETRKRTVAPCVQPARVEASQAASSYALRSVYRTAGVCKPSAPEVATVLCAYSILLLLYGSSKEPTDFLSLILFSSFF